MRPITALLAPMLLSALFALPALAQDAPEPKVNQLIVFGTDSCPQSTDDTITVCARKDESERYRIPEPLREHTSPQNEAWNNKVRAYETVSRTGTMSCSPVGAGGWTGCAGKLINDAYAEKKIDPGIKFGQMIADERAKRLATIDTDAAETQARVEAIETQMEERRKAEEAKADKDPNDTNAPAPPKN
ncbi:MAG: hypothetical protein QFC78_08720 [Pseudomonadota bacterium]|nr:hypothetical protein [Pseudomonadota bacterium]